MARVDMSPAAVTGRLRRASELRRLCLALAGPRLERAGPATSPDVPPVVKERRTGYRAGKQSKRAKP